MNVALKKIIVQKNNCTMNISKVNYTRYLIFERVELYFKLATQAQV
jgi:hypothetical protein